MEININPFVNEKKSYIGKEIALDKDQTYIDAETKEEIPKDVLRYKFKIISISGLRNNKFKAIKMLKGKKYTVILDYDYVIYKLK